MSTKNGNSIYFELLMMSILLDNLDLLAVIRELTLVRNSGFHDKIMEASWGTEERSPLVLIVFRNKIKIGAAKFGPTSTLHGNMIAVLEKTRLSWRCIRKLRSMLFVRIKKASYWIERS